MIRYLRAAPFALLSGGCAARGQPATTPEMLYGEVPPLTRQAESTTAQALARWQLPPSNPWSAYSKYTLLTALDQTTLYNVPDVRQSALVNQAQCAASRLAAAGLPGRTLYVVDLPGAASVAFGATLSQEAGEPVAAVLTFNNWPADEEMIPSEQTLSALLAFEPRLADGPSIPVFLLDRWRLAYRNEVPSDSVTDNRYALNPTDLPDASALVAAGYAHVVYLVEDGAGQQEEDDLNSSFAAYQEQGIRVARVGISELCGPRPTLPDLWLVEDGFRLDVFPRETLLTDCDFYRRCPGGFGGRHASPTRAIFFGHAHAVAHSGGGG